MVYDSFECRRIARSPRSISLFYYHMACVLPRYIYKKNYNNLQSYSNLNILKLNLKNMKCYLRYWCFNLNIIFYLVWGCNQILRSTLSTQDVTDFMLGVCILGPQPALVPGGNNLERGQARVACLSPKPSSPSARCLYPQGVCIQPGSWGLQ